jgi:hypothetical protein
MPNFLVTLGVLFISGAAAPLATAAGQPSAPAPPPTPLQVSATNAPLRTLASDGMEHLEYDLIITNVFSAPVTLTSVEAIAPDGSPLLRLAG